MLTDVSEKLAAFMFKVEGDGDKTFNRKAGLYLPDYTAPLS
jgi:hypothetical protein